MNSELGHILASLRPYAAPLPPGDPPEILPWEWDHPWNVEGAARGTLHLLVEGAEPGPQLYRLADYLVTFIVPSYHWRIAGGRAPDPKTAYRRLQDAVLVNGTALALCGYLCDGAHPEAEIWRTTGSARLATVVHARKAALNDAICADCLLAVCRVADCLLAVCRVADALELPVLADLITLRERMWGRLLDHSRAERLHVSEAQYPAHMARPVSPEEVGALMRARPWQRDACTPDFLGQADLEDADGTCRNLITLRAHMLVRHQFGSEIDWHLRLFDDKESTVSLGAMPFLRNLATAYTMTSDEKYAVHAARLLWSFYRLNPLPNHHQPLGPLWSFYRLNPLPNHHQPLGPWRTLEVGNRQANTWPALVALLGDTEPFDKATHAMMARSRLDHIRYALAFCGGPNNWYQVEAAGLAVAALFSPELRLADAYLRIALRRLKWINSFAYFDDGFQFELSHGYHVFPTSSMYAVVQTAQARGVTLPPDFVGLIERAHEMYLYARQPDYLLPTFNDCNPNPTDPARLLAAAAETFGRDDLLWGATYGREGRLCHARSVGRGRTVPLFRRCAVGRVAPARGQALVRPPRRRPPADRRPQHL